jgi:hypothetical protein
MNVKELRAVLEDAEGILTAAGARGPSKDFRTFLELLQGRDDQPVAEFLAELRERLSGRQVAAHPQPKEPDEDVVAYYVRHLHEAGTAKHVFDGVFSDLSSDRRVGKDEADAIAHAYTGGRDRWPKKSEALRAIEDWFTDGTYQAAKMKQVDKATLL